MQSELEIVLVEDDRDDAELALRVLRNLSNRIVHIQDGAEALSYLLSRPSAGSPGCIVLLDLRLPNIDGLDLLRTLRTCESTRTMPVIILTASREEPEILKSYELGVNSFLIKPVRFESLLKALSQSGLKCMVVTHESDRPADPTGHERIIGR